MKSFLASLPTEDKKGTKLPIVNGTYPNNLNKPKNCIFSDRCPMVTDICKSKKPELTSISDSHSIACFGQEVVPSE